MSKQLIPFFLPPSSRRLLWNVIAFDLNGNEICISESALFTKSAKPQNNGVGGESGGDADDPKPPTDSEW